MRTLEECHLLHVFGIADTLEQLHPMLNGLAVLLLDGREVRLRSLHLFRHCNLPRRRSRLQSRSIPLGIAPRWPYRRIMVSSAASTVDEYVAQLPDDRRLIIST